MLFRTMYGASALAGTLFAMAAPAAAQTIFTNRAAFNAATTGQVVDDFSGLGNGSGYPSGIQGTNYKLSGTGALLISYDPNSSPTFEFNSGKVVGVTRFSPTSTVTFTPGSTVTAFGFDFGVQTGAANSVTIDGTTYTAGDQPGFNFFGVVSTTPLAPITLGFAASRLILDNVTTAAAAPVVPPVGPAVPEPASWAMMIAGFGVIGGALRRRQRVSVRFA